jgi:hypothetical protein
MLPSLQLSCGFFGARSLLAIGYETNSALHRSKPPKTRPFAATTFSVGDRATIDHEIMRP